MIVEREAAVMRITLSRAPINAVNAELTARLRSVVEQVRASHDLVVLHIRSNQRVFSAGGDLAFIRGVMNSATPQADMREFVANLQAVLNDLATLPVISVCEIDGAAFGGGLEIALACDFRIASERAQLGLPEVGLGLLSAAGGTQRLTRLIGLSHARRVILLNATLDARTAHAVGLVDEVHPATECALRTREFIAALLSKPRQALAEAKACVAEAVAANERGYRLELDAIARLIGSEETRQRVTAFLNKAR